MMTQFLHLVVLAFGATDLAGSLCFAPNFSAALWLYFSMLILWRWLPAYTEYRVNSQEEFNYSKVYNTYVFIIVGWISLLFAVSNPIKDTNQGSFLSMVSAMVLYLILLKPFMLSLYKIQSSHCNSIQSQKDFLRSRQIPSIIFFPPLLLWALLEDLGLTSGMELMGEIRALAVAPVFVFVLYLLSPLLFNKAWNTKGISGQLTDSIKELCKKAETPIAGVRLWSTFHEDFINAAVAGIISRFRFVYITDFLLHIFKRDEIEAVVAHELGHFRLGHVLTYFVYSINLILLTLVVKSCLILYFPYLYIHGSLTYVLEIAFIVLLFVLSFPPLSRFCEKQADDFALAITNPDSFVNALELLHMLTPPRSKWFPKWLLGHPETEKRMENAIKNTKIKINTLIKQAKMLRYSLLGLVFVLIILALKPTAIVIQCSNLYNAAQAGNCRLVSNLCNSLPGWLFEHPFVLEQRAKSALNSGNYVLSAIIAFKAHFGIELISMSEVPHHSGSPEVALDFKVVQLILKFLNF